MNHCMGVNRAFEGERVKLVTQIEKAQHVLTWAVCGGQLQPLSRQLPGIRDARLQCEPGFVEIPEVKLARRQKRFDAQSRQVGLSRAEFLFVAKKAQAPAHSLPGVIRRLEDALEGVAADDFADLVGNAL